VILDPLTAIRTLVPGVLFGVALTKIFAKNPRYFQLIIPRYWKFDKRRFFEALIISSIFAFTMLGVCGFLWQLLSQAGYLLVNEEEYLLTPEKIPKPILFCLTNFLACVEEWIFRGVLLEEISRSSGSRWMGLCASSLVFGIFHLSNPGTYPPLALIPTVGGFILGTAYLLRGLFCSTCCHCIYNSFLVFVS